MKTNRYDGVDPYAIFFVSYRAKTLIKTPFFTYDDYEDIQQELMLAYLYAWPKFCSKKGDKRSFIKAVVNNHAFILIRDASVQKRWSGQKDLSLFSVIDNEEEPIELIDAVSSIKGLWGDMFAGISHEFVEQNLDIKKLLRDMPEDVLMTYELLKNKTVAEASRETGIPRTTLSSRKKKLREYIRSRFHE